MGTFAWGPLLGNLCLATFACKPLLVNLCLGTFGERALELLRSACNHGNLEKLGWQTLSETVPCNFGNLGNFVGTFIWKPFWFYLGILLHNKAHSTHISPSHPSSQSNLYPPPSQSPGPPFSNLSAFNSSLHPFFPQPFPIFPTKKNNFSTSQPLPFLPGPLSQISHPFPSNFYL